MGRMGGRGGDRGGFLPRGPRGSRGNPSGGGNVQHRAGDWQCPNPYVLLPPYPGESCGAPFVQRSLTLTLL